MTNDASSVTQRLRVPCAMVALSFAGSVGSLLVASAEVSRGKWPRLSCAQSLLRMLQHIHPIFT
jgi:hypothetical protein